PHLEADAVAQAPRVLPRPAQARSDARGVLRMKGEPFRHRPPIRPVEVLTERAFVSGQSEERRPLLGDDALGAGNHGRFHDGVVVHVEEARSVLHPLDVPPDPVQVLGDSAEHQPWPVSDRSQVSLEPPPCEELTTSEPRLSATRVSPPGTTVMSSPT